MNNTKKIGVLTSGGDCSGLNAVIRAVVNAASQKGWEVYGILNGTDGLTETPIQYEVLTEHNYSDSAWPRLSGSYLGSLNKGVKMESLEEMSAKFGRGVKELGLDAIVVIGGDGSMNICGNYCKGAGIKMVGIPKTIDNDLMYTDHTPGFGSAVKYVTTTLAEIAQDSAVYNLPSVTIVEIMGRDAGWLTASTCLLHQNGLEAPHLIYLPEIPFSTERFMSDVRRMHASHKSVIVAVSEGVRLSEGGYAADDFQSGENDAFGHKYLAGVGKYLENMLRKHLGCKVRSIELNVMQRCAAHLASETDISEALQVGACALCTMLEGKSGCMMTLQRTGDAPYGITISTVEAQRVANRIRLFPQEWITPDGNGVCDEAIPYFLPLIQGDRQPIMRNGMPVHFTL